MKLFLTLVTVVVGTRWLPVTAFCPSASNQARKQEALLSLRAHTVEARDMSSLRSWADSVGVFRDKLNLEQDKDTWGVTLSHSAEEGTAVLKIPSSVILSSDKIEQELDTNVVGPALEFLRESKFQGQVPQFLLFVKILLEYERKNDSRWYTWMQSLPRKFDTSVCMDEVELECLPPFAWALANIERMHLDYFRQALDKLPKHFLPARNEEHTRWAFNVVFTRCWRYPDKYGQERCDIVPFGDMFNHGEMNIALDYVENDDCVVSLAQDVDAGMPLHLSYGRESNPYRFMAMFGFVNESQPEIMCQVKASEPSQKHVDLGYDFDKMVFRTKDGAISNQVWDVMLYSILAQVPDVQETFYQAHMKGDRVTKAAIHDKFLLENCITLRKHVDGTLNEMKGLYAKILEQDESKHPRLGMIRKNNELVSRTFEKVKNRLDEMIKSEMARRKAKQETS